MLKFPIKFIINCTPFICPLFIIKNLWVKWIYMSCFEEYPKYGVGTPSIFSTVSKSIIKSAFCMKSEHFSHCPLSVPYMSVAIFSHSSSPENYFIFISLPSTHIILLPPKNQNFGNYYSNWLSFIHLKINSNICLWLHMTP